MDLAVLVYRLAKRLPREERYGLWSQMTRAAVSVPANIAEGHARATAKDYAQFIAIAKGSLMELETYLTLTTRLKYLSEQQAQPALALVTQISKMLTSLRRNLMNKSSNPAAAP
jgi:four helix bundle protein